MFTLFLLLVSSGLHDHVSVCEVVLNVLHHTSFWGDVALVGIFLVEVLAEIYVFRIICTVIKTKLEVDYEK